MIRIGFSYTNKKGTKYYLHKGVNKLRKSTIYYFSKSSKDSINIPDKYTVIEAKKTGLPLLKKK